MPNTANHPAIDRIFDLICPSSTGSGRAARSAPMPGGAKLPVTLRRAVKRSGQGLRPTSGRLNALAGLSVCAVLLGATGIPAQAQIFDTLEEVAVPIDGGAEGPSLSVFPDGRVAMSWMAPTGPASAAVRIAVLDGMDWSDPVTVAEGEDVFLNYADFPSSVVLPDGTLAFQWLRTNGNSYFAYDTNIAFSRDDGATWGAPILPHRDGTQQQHGFVSLLPDGAGGLVAMWLDGRDNEGGETYDAMQLRTATVSPDGTLTQELSLDARTCSCCQTAATALDDGTILLAYRDRTQAEIRDISLVRRIDGQWSEPEPVSQDGWEIPGCPVNGPAIDASGTDVALVWFTAANGEPAVRMAFSDDGGDSFSAPLPLDLGSPVGGVDVVALSDGSALVSWLERTAAGEALLICRATPEAGCGDPVALTISPSGHTIGFPRMVAAQDDVYIVWNEPSRDATTGRADGATVVRLAHGVLTQQP